jgi:hypothetical protein
MARTDKIPPDPIADLGPLSVDPRRSWRLVKARLSSMNNAQNAEGYDG